jgi:hypothetical protein
MDVCEVVEMESPIAVPTAIGAYVHLQNQKEIPETLSTEPYVKK